MIKEDKAPEKNGFLKEGFSTGSLIAADGKLLILEDIGILHIAEASPSSYKEISSCKLPPKKMHQWWSYPVLSKSRVYCRNGIGDLVCIDVSKTS